MNRRLLLVAFAFGFGAFTSPAGAQSPAPSSSVSPSPSAAASSTPGAYDGHYLGGSKTSECREGDVDLTIKAGAVTGAVQFDSGFSRDRHTYLWNATGTVAADGTVTVHFKSDDTLLENKARNFLMTGTASGERIDLKEDGGSCGFTMALSRAKK